MAQVLITDAVLSAIADAIRTKNGTDRTYRPSEMAPAIMAMIMQMQPYNSLQAFANRDKHNTEADHPALIDLTDCEVENIPARFCACPQYINSTMALNATSTYYLTDKLIAPNLKWIGNAGFHGYNIKEMYVPNLVTLNSYAYTSNKTLQKLILPRCISLGEKAFAFNTALNLAYLPSATSVGGCTFHSCEALKTVILGPDLVSLGGASGSPDNNASAFYNCKGLEEIYFKGNIPPKACYQGSYYYTNLGGVFHRNTTKKPKVYVPTASVDAYKTALGDLVTSYGYQVIGMNVEDMPTYDDWGNLISGDVA